MAYGRCIADFDRLVPKPNDTPAVTLSDGWALQVAAAERRLPELATVALPLDRLCLNLCVGVIFYML